MHKIELIEDKKQSDQKSSSPLTALLFLIAGVYGILLFLQQVPGITFIGEMLYLAPAVICTALWYVYFYRKKMFPLLVAIVLLISCVAVFMARDILLVQLGQIADILSGKKNLEVMAVTELAILLTVLASVVLFVFEIILHNHMILFLVISGILLMAPLFGIRPGTGVVVVLFFFQIIFWTVQLPKRSKGSRSLKGKSIQITAVIITVSVLAALPLVSHYAQEFYDFVFEVEGYVYRTANLLSGRAGNPITGGRIHGGNNYRTGTAHLGLTVSEQPRENLYLRGFGGGEYVGGDWIRSSDEELFINMAEKLDWQEWEYRISTMYYNMYFVMNSNTLDEGDDSLSPFSLTVRHLNGEYGNAYVPYYSQRDRGWNFYQEDGAGRDGYIYQYFEQSDMNIKWDNVTPDFEETRDRYMELQAAYVEEIQTAYTQVPTELLPRLTELVEENPMEGLNEISTFILYTLHSNASYTLTPGWAPLNEDIAEYFLFESGQGYCEHFALTATLMYRMYGIPARYATGYMVSPSSFVLQEDGTWQAFATDEDAHAWTEIFLEDYGWTPIEVTPAADGSTVAGYPGFGSTELNRILTERNWNMAIPSLTETVLSSADAGETDRSTELEWRINFAEHEELLWILGTALIYSLFLVPFFLDYRRLRHLKKIETMNCRKVFFRFIKMLHFAGYFQEYDGSEKDFVSEFAAEIPVVSPDEIAQLQNIVCAAAYGFENPTIEKEELVKNIYFRTSLFLYGRLKWSRKLLFRYWNMYG